MPRKQLPKYRLHKASDQARVTLDGKTYYLGKYQSPKSWENYYIVTQKYLERKNHNTSQELHKPPTKPPANLESVSCKQLVVLFLEYAKTHCTKRVYDKHRIVGDKLLHHYANTPVEDFAPVSLLFLQNEWVGKGYTRSTINGYSNAVKNIFKWGALLQYVPLATYQAVQLLPALNLNSTAKPDRKVLPVDTAIVEQTLPHLPQVIQDMIRVQLILGGRPQDVCRMKKPEIDTTSDPKVWIYTMPKHKTTHRGKIRQLTIGPKAQAILKPYLEQADSYLFTIRNKHIPPTSYYSYVDYVCRTRGIPHWHPNQLRHTKGTFLRHTYGIELAQAALGHSSLNTSEIYTEINRRKTREIALEIG
jgi:integrase